MRINKNNHLFISASVSLILISFFIVIERDKTDKLLLPEKPKVIEEETHCRQILKDGLALEIKSTDESILAMNRDSTRLDEILEFNSIVALKNAVRCLGRSPLEVNIDQFSKNIASENDPAASLMIINKISGLLENALGNSVMYKNIDLKVVTNISLNKNDNKT